jgi:arylsulfatase A-like enzyme
VSISANEYDLGGILLEPAAAEYRITVPPETLVAGENGIRITYSHTNTPRMVLSGSTDERQLGAAWDWLRIDNAMEPMRPHAAEKDSGTLILPVNVRLDYFVDVGAGSSLVIEEARPWTREGCLESTELWVSLQTLTERAEKRFKAPFPRPVEVLVPATSAQELVQVSLMARCEIIPKGTEAGLRLQRPAIRYPSQNSMPGEQEKSSKRDSRPNIIIYLMDTLRADHLGCYGYSKGATPGIDSFAAAGTLFSKAYAQSSWTKSSVGSIVTGLLPRAHAANRRDQALPSSVLTVAERLANIGYSTAGFVTNPNLVPEFGFDQGFETYEVLEEKDPQRGYVRSDELNSSAIAWLETRSSERPFFLYLHSMDPHDPYLEAGLAQPGSEPANIGSMAFMKALEEGKIEATDEIRERLLSLYDSEIAFNDRSFEKLMQWLDSAGLYDSSLIILLSDHGEEFYDHGWWRHGKTLYREQLEVPLIVKWPRGLGAGERIDGMVQHVDLLPTILDYLGEPIDESLHGRSVLELLKRRDGHITSRAFSYLDLDGRELEAVTFRDRKLIRYLVYDRPAAPLQLFDLATDRGESRNLTSERRQATRFLSSLLGLTRGSTRSPVSVVIDEELEKKLKALGYMK